MTRIFFALAPKFASQQDYNAGIQRVMQNYGYEAVFAHDSPALSEPGQWLAEKMSECGLAMFDLTGFDANVLFAYGVASQLDLPRAALIDIDEHESIADGKTRSTFLVGERLKTTKTFLGAGDFSRKVADALASTFGADVLKDDRLVRLIKDHIAHSPSPVPMRKIATSVGRQMSEVQPIVYALVRNGAVKMVGDKRWAQYQSAN